MNYRLNEGNGEAFYEIGVTDNGTALGLTEDLLNENINILTNIAKSIDANAKLEYKIKSNISFSLSNKKYLMMYSKLNNINESDIDINADRYIAHILVRRNLKDNKYICLRICVAGNVDAGKSTSIATLTHGELDNGDGKSRVIMFGHKHEIESGRTTNISQEIIGYDENGNVVNELLKKV
jgi:GTPase